MKRLWTMILAVILVVAVSATVSFAAEVRTVYLDPASGLDTNDGLTEAAPVQTVEAAYAALEGADEGKIIILSTLTLSSTEITVFPECDIPVTLTSATGAEGITTAKTVYFSGDTTLENMTLTLDASNNTTYFSSQGHNMTMGEGLTCKNSSTYRFCLTTQHGEGSNGNATLMVKSGQWRNIFYGGYNKATTGDATLIMSGGSVNNLVGPSFSAKTNGNMAAYISGGSISILMTGPNETGNHTGNVELHLSGGTISKVRLKRVINSKVIPVYGTATVYIEGDCTSISKILHESASGHIDKTVLVLKQGILDVTPCTFDEVRVEIPEGKTLKLAGSTIEATSVNSAGTLIFSGAASLTADSITGTLNCEVADTVNENHAYVTAPADSTVTFPESTGVVGQDGIWKLPVAFDTENFVGLVLKTTAPDISVKFFQNYNTTDDKLITPVHTEDTEDGGSTYYYEIKALNRYYLIAKPASGYGRYNNHYNLYFTAEEAATKTVMDVTPNVRSSNGWDPSTEIRHRTSEVMDNVYPSDASLWPQYAEIFTTPAFQPGRNEHMQTTQTEMEDFIAGLDDANDHMYVYTLGQSAGKAFDIPLVIFTTVDLSQAETLEQAAALIRADSEKNNKLTIHHQGQIHGNEPAAGEASLGMLLRLDSEYGESLLDTMNIYVIPRLSPYGAYKSQRYVDVNGSKVDPNRDFLRLRTAETQARMVAYNLFEPEVVFDSHEYQETLTTTSHKRKDLMLCTHWMPNHDETYRQTALDLAYAAFDQITADGLYYSWYSDSVGGMGANTGSSNTAFRSSLHILMETSGINQGLVQYERRVATHVSALTGLYAYLDQNAAAVKKTVQENRQQYIENGLTYREDDIVILDATTSNHEELNIQDKMVNLYNGNLTDATYPAYVPDVINRSRIAPTAYVIPAGESYTDTVLALMDKQGISYSFIPAGSSVLLQQYIGTVEKAQLTEERQTYFPGGAYVFTMNQVDGYILANLMEPDVDDAAENKGTLAQQGIITPTDGVFPIYRYIHDLNENGAIDYFVPQQAPVVYLKQSAADDTGDGLTEETAVQTLATAYAKLETLMAAAPEGTMGKIILLDTYTLPTGKVTFPSCSFPVEITAKVATDGIYYEGGSTENANVVIMGGDTTFHNLTLTLKSEKSNNFFGGGGHKLVIGRGVTCVSDSTGTGAYFSLCGGAYNSTYETTDVTVLSGYWAALNLGNFASGTVKGDAHLYIDGAHFTSTIRSSYKNAAINGDVYMDIQNVTGSGSIYGGASNNGKNYGNLNIRLGENISKTNVYACASNSTIDAKTTFTIIADGVDLTTVNIRGQSATGSDGVTQYLPCTLILKRGELADVIDTFAVREDATVILGRNQTTEAAVTKSFNLDLAGFDAILAVADGATVTAYDSATDDYTVNDGQYYGKLTATGTVAAADGYVTLDNKSFHKLSQRISTVALRPHATGIYYGATWQCDEVLAEKISTYGIALSVANMPDDGFATDSDTMYTQEDGSSFVSGKAANSVLVENILKVDAQDNDGRGQKDIHALPYVTFEGNKTYVSDGISYSLYDVMHLLDQNAYEENSASLNAFYTTWKTTMEAWGFTNIGK